MPIQWFIHSYVRTNTTRIDTKSYQMGFIVSENPHSDMHCSVYIRGCGYFIIHHGIHVLLVSLLASWFTGYVFVGEYSNSMRGQLHHERQFWKLSDTLGHKEITFCLQTFCMRFPEWKLIILIQIAHNIDPKGSIGYMSVMVQYLAWHRTGEKPLLEPKITQLIEASLC